MMPGRLLYGSTKLDKNKNLHAEVQVGGVNDPGWAGVTEGS